MNEKKVLLIDGDLVPAAAPRSAAEAKKPPLVYKYNSAAGPFRKGFTEPGRNAPCPCGSGKKYKHCHLEKLTAGVRAKVVEASRKNQEAK